MKKRNLLVFVLSTAMLSGVVASCSDNQTSSSTNAPKKIEKITVGTNSKIEKATRDEYAYDMLASGVSEMPLISKNANGEYSPLLASYKTTDSKTWTYTIQDGMKWSDGSEVTAKDVLFSLNYEATEEMPAFTTGDKKGSYSSYSLSDDNKSISLVLETPSVKALDAMTVLRVRPEHIYKDKTTDNISEADARVTCGPYKLESFDKASNSITYIANEYYPTQTNVNKIVYKLFSNEDVMYTALTNGELDFIWNYSTGVSSTYQSVLDKANNIKLESVASTNCPAMLTFNNKKGLMSDKNIRFAVSYALDYNSFKTYFGSPYAKTPNRSFAPSSLVGYKPTVQLETNLATATNYMTDAGYAKGTKYWEKDGTTAQFALTVNSGKANHVGYAEFVKTQLEAFGIKVNLDAVDSVTYNEKTSHKFATEGKHQYGEITMEAAIMGYTSFGMSNLGGMYINGNHTVQGGAECYSDELNTAMSDMDKSKTLEEYVTAAGKLQDYYAKETPAIALYWDNIFYAHNVAINNLVIDGTFGLNNINTWFKISK